MLAPLRDYLRPKDPASSPLLGMTKECYFTRLSVNIDPDNPTFEESKWVSSEDVNVEHLLDVFISVDPNSKNVWDACIKFMVHLFWHKPRVVILGPKIEALPDNHPSKAECLQGLSFLFDSVGNRVEQKRLLSHSLKLWREQGNDHQVALTLRFLSVANRLIGLHKEGIQQAKEASGIFERLGETMDHARCLIGLARALKVDDQLDAAEEAASRALDLLPEKGEQFHACQGHRVLGEIYRAKGDTEKAIHHFEAVLGIASSFDWHSQLFWIHWSLAQLFSGKGRFDDAHAHLQHAKSRAVSNLFQLARASQLQARFWYKQHRPEEAGSEAFRALGLFEKLGATNHTKATRKLLGRIDALVE